MMKSLLDDEPSTHRRCSASSSNSSPVVVVRRPITVQCSSESIDCVLLPLKPMSDLLAPYRARLVICCVLSLITFRARPKRLDLHAAPSGASAARTPAGTGASGQLSSGTTPQPEERQRDEQAGAICRRPAAAV